MKTAAKKLRIRLTTFWFYFYGTEAIQSLLVDAPKEPRNERAAKILRKAILAGERALQNENPEVIREDLEYLRDVIYTARTNMAERLPRADVSNIYSLIHWLKANDRPASGQAAANIIMEQILETQSHMAYSDEDCLIQYANIIPWPLKSIVVSYKNSTVKNQALSKADKELRHLEKLVRNFLPYMVTPTTSAKMH